jgi:hypothetical protein
LVLQVELWQNGTWLDLGSQYILTVPYASHSNTANTAVDMSLDQLTDVNYEELPVDGDKLVYSDYYAEWVPSSLVPGYVEGAWSTNENSTFVSTGLVGIGTSTPNNKLHVNDGAIQITRPAYGNGVLDGIIIGQDGTGNALLSNNENTDMVFSTGFLERFRLGANGPVLPLDYPGHKFHVKSTFPGLGMHLTYTTFGHNSTDGTKIGLNGSGELEINQQENANIVFKRNGTTKATITNAGLDIDGGLVAGALDVSTVEAIGVDTYQMDTENLYVHSAEGTGVRKLYATAGGQVFAPPAVDKFYSVGPADFQAWSPSDPGQADAVVDYRIGEAINTLPHEFHYQENDNNEFYATLHLPHGAILKSAKARVRDEESGRNWWVKIMWSKTFDGDVAENNGGYIDMYSTVSNGYQTLEENFWNSPVVDNENYVYFAVITVTGDGELLPDEEAMGFVSLVIKYTEPSY